MERYVKIVKNFYPFTILVKRRFNVEYTWCVCRVSMFDRHLLKTKVRHTKKSFLVAVHTNLLKEIKKQK